MPPIICLHKQPPCFGSLLRKPLEYHTGTMRFAVNPFGYHRESETFTGATPIGTNNEDFKHSSIPGSFYPLNNANKLKKMTEK